MLIEPARRRRPRLPAKSLYRKFSASHLERRRHLLQIYLSASLIENQTVLCQDEDVQSFLGITNDDNQTMLPQSVLHEDSGEGNMYITNDDL